MGKWISRASEAHQHDAPKTVNGHSIAIGDEWECACGARLRVDTCKNHEDYNDNWQTLTWQVLTHPSPPTGRTYYGPYGYGNSQPYS